MKMSQEMSDSRTSWAGQRSASQERGGREQEMGKTELSPGRSDQNTAPHTQAPPGVQQEAKIAQDSQRLGEVNV